MIKPCEYSGGCEREPRKQEACNSSIHESVNGPNNNIG